MPLADANGWPGSTWTKQGEAAKNQISPFQRAETHRIFKVLPERPHRLWVHHDGGRYLVDCAGLVQGLPKVPAWDEWRLCFVSDDRSCVRWPSGLTLPFGQEPSSADPIILATLTPDQTLYRPLYDRHRANGDWRNAKTIQLLFSFTESELMLLKRDLLFAEDVHLVDNRLMDFAEYVMVQYIVGRGFRRLTPQIRSKAKRHFAEYLNAPPAAAWVRRQYPTRRSIIAAGGIHLAERELLKNEWLKRAVDAHSLVL